MLFDRSEVIDSSQQAQNIPGMENIRRKGGSQALKAKANGKLFRGVWDEATPPGGFDSQSHFDSNLEVSFPLFLIK